MASMEITYTMIGADGLQYGPITLAQIQTWIREGRVTGDTKILRSDTNAWLPASSYSELGLVAVPVVSVPAPGQMPSPEPAATVANWPRALTADDLDLVRRVRAGASWFFVIAVLSLVNSLMAMANTGGFFLVGLGINALWHNFPINIFFAGMFAVFGYFARQGHTLSFIAGMILYALDALIFLQAAAWLPFAFHVYALFRIFMGLRASTELKGKGR